MTNTLTARKFHVGDRVVQDLNKLGTPQLERKTVLITHGTVLEYRIMPGTTSPEIPFIQWDNNRTGYAKEADIEHSDKPEPQSTDASTAVIDVPHKEVSPGLERLEQLELDIKAGFEEVHKGIRRIQTAAFEIKEDSLWEEAGYDSFEDYGEKKWGWKKSNLYDLAAAGKTFYKLRDSGIPESDIPEATSTLKELAKADNPTEIIEDAKVAGKDVTVASIKRSLKKTPSLELIIALWSQLGTVARPARLSQPERIIVNGDLFDHPLTFETIKDAQAAWDQDAQRLSAIAVERKIAPDPDAKKSLCYVPCKVTSTGRKGQKGAQGQLMGDWADGIKDAAGNRPKAWDYPVRLPGKPVLQSFHLFQLKVLWPNTYDWMPQRYEPAHPAVPAAPTTDYQHKESSPLYKADDTRGQEKQAIAQKLPNLAPFPTGNYSLIVADPSWKYDLRETDATHRNRTPYPPMEDEEILELPMADLAAEDAYLLLWVTNNHLPLAYDCLAYWGFACKNIHTWIKVDSSGKPRMGTGHYGRNCTEHYLVATKGKPPSWSTLGLTSIPSVLFAPRPKQHSRKPHEFWEQRAEVLRNKLGGEAIELFARQPRENWHRWGLEAD